DDLGAQDRLPGPGSFRPRALDELQRVPCPCHRRQHARDPTSAVTGRRAVSSRGHADDPEGATMRVFLAGASGAIGRRLVPELLERGHEVVAMTRSPRKVDALRDAGAFPVVADGLDRDAVMAAVVGAEPEVVVHELTALADAGMPRRFDG